MPKSKALELIKKVRASVEFKTFLLFCWLQRLKREQVTEAVLSGVSPYIVRPLSGKILEDKLKAVWDKHKK